MMHKSAKLVADQIQKAAKLAQKMDVVRSKAKKSRNLSDLKTTGKTYDSVEELLKEEKVSKEVISLFKKLRDFRE
jgi:hypothetical protein